MSLSVILIEITRVDEGYGFAITPLSLRDISPIRGISSTATEFAVIFTELRGYGFAITPLSALQTSPLSGESRSSLQIHRAGRM